jgi:alpha-galactosidase
VIEVDQDPLGRQAQIVTRTTDTLILAKDMEDGSKAVGLFNLGRAPSRIAVDWAALALSGPQRTRDLWRQKDIGVLKDSYSAEVRRHGVMLVRLWPEK